MFANQIKQIGKITTILALSATLSAAISNAEVPEMINYQGRVTDSEGDPLTGDYWMTFSIWDDPEAGEMLWHSNPRSMVHVED
ncbi:MAG: hypothetical protein JSV44_04115, partial [Candidatus Zixiibacteriota bacterium]